MKQTNYFKPDTNKTCSQKTIKTKKIFILFTSFWIFLFTAWLALPHDELWSLLSIKLITLRVGLDSHDSLGISPYGNSVMSVYFSFMSCEWWVVLKIEPTFWQEYFLSGWPASRALTNCKTEKSINYWWFKGSVQVLWHINGLQGWIYWNFKQKFSMQIM